MKRTGRIASAVDVASLVIEDIIAVCQQTSSSAPNEADLAIISSQLHDLTFNMSLAYRPPIVFLISRFHNFASNRNNVFFQFLGSVKVVISLESLFS